MRYRTARRIQDFTMIGLLALGYVVAYTAEAQTCPPLASAGTYTATVPWQASGCTMTLQVVPPEEVGIAVGDLNCPGAPRPGRVAAVALPYPNEEGVCTLDLTIRTGGVLIADEGEDVYEGTGFGLTEPVLTSDPLAVCQAAADAGLLASGEILELRAVNVTHYATNPVTRFACEGRQFHPGVGMELDFGPSGGGTISLVATNEPAYLEGELRIDAVGEAVEGNGVVDSMTTPDARVIVGRGEHPAGTVTIQRAELPY